MGPQSITPRRSKTFCARGAAKRLHLERLPGYAPELNPQEGVWNLLKDVNSRISAVEMSPTWLMSFGMPKNACDIGRPFSNSVLLMQGVLFSYPCRGQ